MLPNYPIFVGKKSTLYNGLRAFWNFEETDGVSPRVDATGNGVDLTSVGDVQGGNAFGKILHGNNIFNSITQGYFHRTADALINVNGQDFSFAGWFRLNDNTGQRMILTKYAGANQGFYFYLDAGISFKWFLQNTILDSGVIPTASTWFFFYLSFVDASKVMRIVMQDNAGANLCDVNTVAASNITENTGDFEIGAYFAGLSPSLMNIDAVGFWNRTLTAPELAELINSGTGKQYPL